MWRSMKSDMSMRTIASSEPKRASARALGHEGLADSRRPEENEGAEGSPLVRDAGAGTAHGRGNGLDRVRLAYDPAMHGLLEAKEAVSLALREASEGNARGLGEDQTEVILGDGRTAAARACLPVGLEGIEASP